MYVRPVYTHTHIEGERAKERERERDRECVCVCAHHPEAESSAWRFMGCHKWGYTMLSYEL